MKISSYSGNLLYQTKYQNKARVQKQDYQEKKNHNLTLSTNNLIPINRNYVIFKGISADKKLQDYKRSNLNFVDFVKTTSFSYPEFSDFMFQAINDETLSERTISDLTKNPTESTDNIQLLESKFGGKTQFLKWYVAKNGYARAYEKYLNDTALVKKFSAINFARFGSPGIKTVSAKSPFFASICGVGIISNPPY